MMRTHIPFVIVGFCLVALFLSDAFYEYINNCRHQKSMMRTRIPFVIVGFCLVALFLSGAFYEYINNCRHQKSMMRPRIPIVIVGFCLVALFLSGTFYEYPNNWGLSGKMKKVMYRLAFGIRPDKILKLILINTNR